MPATGSNQISGTAADNLMFLYSFAYNKADMADYTSWVIGSTLGDNMNVILFVQDKAPTPHLIANSWQEWGGMVNGVASWPFVPWVKADCVSVKQQRQRQRQRVRRPREV